MKTSRCASTVEVRFLRFWEARNVKRGGELMGVDMLLLDSHATLFPVTVNVHRLPAFRHRLTEGATYSISGFEVTRCNQSYRLSDSALMIRFTDSTSLVDVAEPVPPIAMEYFRFRNQIELIGLENTSAQLPDVIGELTAVKSIVTDPLEEKSRLMAIISAKNG